MPLESTPGKRPAKTRPQYRDGGKRWPSVTTVIKVIDSPGLDRWRVNQALKGIDPYRDMSAADAGTLTHSAIEWALTGGEYPATEGTDPEVLAHAMAAFKSFRAWQQAHTVEVVACELVMASAALGYGGTLDLLAVVDGRLEVLDFKTSVAVYGEYFVQTSAYARLLAETSEHRPEGLRIVRLDKSIEEIGTDLYRPAPKAPVFEDVTVGALPSDTLRVEPGALEVSPRHFEVFQHALALHELNKEIGGRYRAAA